MGASGQLEPPASHNLKNSPSSACIAMALCTRTENGRFCSPGAPVDQAMGSSTPSMTNARKLFGNMLA